MKRNRKRTGMICMLAATAVVLGGCAQGQGKMAYIGADAAKKQILAEVGLDESQVKINSVDMATRNGMDYYQVEFSDENGNTYRYDIEALTGKVIESGSSDTAGNAADGTVAETTAAAAEAVKETTSAAAEAGKETTSAVTEAAKETTAAAVRTLAASGTTAAAKKADTGSSSKLTAEEAKAKALAHAGLSASEVTFTKSKLDWENGKQVYDVEFYGSDGMEYDYEIDAYSGAVISADKDLEVRPAQSGTGSAGNNTSGRETAGTQTAQQQTAQQQTTQQQTTQQQAAQQQTVQQQTPPAAGAGSTKLTVEEAKAKALAHAGLSASQTITFMKAELDWDDGKQIYDVEFYGSDGTEYDYEIDASTGAVIKYDTETPEGNTSAPYTVTNNLSADDAKALALQQVPGATLSDIAEFETDREDGRIEYEGKIYYGGMEYEFEIDGYSGAFRKWECEQDDDHHDGHH